MTRRRRISHGTGLFEVDSLAACGEGCVFEIGVLIFHAENIFLGEDLYVGHYTILKGYHINEMRIGNGTWIGQQCFLHAAGGLSIGERVGIGPGVRILTSQHDVDAVDAEVPVVDAPVKFNPVEIESGADIGAGAVVLPGVRVGRNAVIGAGAVVTRDIPTGAIAAGAPAKILRIRS